MERTGRPNIKAEEINRNKLDLEAITVIIKDTHTGEILSETKGASILFATLIEQQEDSVGFNSGMAGEFSNKTIINSLEAVVDASIQGLKQTNKDFDAEDFIQLMSALTSETLDRNFNNKEKLSALLFALSKALKD